MFKKIIKITPPFDKRHIDPNKNYGIGGLVITFILKGKKGATQFVFATAQHQKKVADELYYKHKDSEYNPFLGMAYDIGYHSKTPMFEGQKKMKCDLIKGGCYYDGSSLQAEEFENEFLEYGEEAVWKMLEDRYKSIFELTP